MKEPQPVGLHGAGEDTFSCHFSERGVTHVPVNHSEGVWMKEVNPAWWAYKFTAQKWMSRARPDRKRIKWVQQKWQWKLPAWEFQQKVSEIEQNCERSDRKWQRDLCDMKLDIKQHRFMLYEIQYNVKVWYEVIWIGYKVTVGLRKT